MSWTVFLTGLSSALQLLLAVLGVYVSLSPPSREAHLKWFAAFILLGLGGIAVTISQQVTNDRDADSKNAAIIAAENDLKVEQQKGNTKMDRLFSLLSIKPSPP